MFIRTFTAAMAAIALIATTPAQAGGRHDGDAAVAAALITGIAAIAITQMMKKKRHRHHFRGRGRPHFGHHRPRRFRGEVMPRGERFVRPRRHPIYGDSRPFGERDRQMWYGRR